jgi:hypothetical protein
MIGHPTSPERPKQRGQPVNPYEQGQIDAQRTSPQPPHYSDPDDIAAYLDGWRVADPDRPVPHFPRPRQRRQAPDLRVMDPVERARARRTLDERVTDPAELPPE